MVDPRQQNPRVLAVLTTNAPEDHLTKGKV